MARFSDVKKLITDGEYAVAVPLSQLKNWLAEQEQGGGYDMDMDYQRVHRWNDEQRSRYVEFLLRGGKSCRTIYWNHPGYTRARRPDSDLREVLELVDGKQRLTACLKFLDNQLPVFGHYLEEYDDETDRRGALGMTGAALIMSVNCLQLRKDVLQWYLDINSGGTPHTDEELRKVEEMLAAEQEGNR